MLEFGLMQIEGFRSIDKEQFDWSLRGLNIIQAPNGTGKTTFINALVWGLYGQTLSGSVEPWEHIKSKSYKGTKVVIPFTVAGLEYKVVRYKNYSKLKNALIFSHEGVDFEGDKTELNRKIIEVIGYTYDLFKNSIIFGQKLKRLISESGPNKKKVFDDAFELSYLPKAKSIAENSLKDLRVELSKQQRIVDNLETRVYSKESEIESQVNMVNNFEKDKKLKIKSERALISELNQELRGLGNKENLVEKKNKLKADTELLKSSTISQKELKEKERELFRKQMVLENLGEEKAKIQANIDYHKSLLGNIPLKCETCGKPFTAKDKQKEKKRIGEIIISLKNDLFLNSKTLGDTEKATKELESYISSQTKDNNLIDNNIKEIEELVKVILNIAVIKGKRETHKQNIKSEKSRILKNNLEELNSELSELKSKLKVESKELGKISRDIKTYEWLIKDPLSNSGIRAFIFNNMLDTINDRLEYYNKFTGFQAAFFIDMKSANKNIETYIFSNNEPVPYNDLSGGQQQCVDIVTAFAIHDVVADTKYCSLLVMDELFESLDKDNIELVTELVNDKTHDKCLYLITHRPEFNPINANIINLNFDGKYTTVE